MSAHGFSSIHCDTTSTTISNGKSRPYSSRSPSHIQQLRKYSLSADYSITSIITFVLEVKADQYIKKSII